MFKNNKEKDDYISTEEVEKMYEFQKKAFEARIAEQEDKIDELADYISARFGENVANSNIASQLKNIEKNLQEIETNYKTNLEKTTKALKKQIEKEGQKIAADLNDAQTEAYFKLLQKNENDMSKIKKFVDEKEDNDERIFNLDKIVKAHIKENEVYQKEIQDELKSTNQKIGKINYLGISNKFDKRIKEECEKITDKIEETKCSAKEDINKLDEKFLSTMEQMQEHLQSNEEEVGKLREVLAIDIKEVNQKIQNNGNELASLDRKLSDEVETINENVENFEEIVENFEEKMSKEIATVSEDIQYTQKKVTSLDEKLSKELIEINENITNSEKCFNKIDEKFSKKIDKISSSNKEKEAALNKIDKRVTKEIEKINISLQNNKNEISILDQKITEKNDEVNIKIQNTENLVNKLDEKISKKIDTAKLVIKKNKDAISNLEQKVEAINTKLNNNETVIKELNEKQLENVNAKIENNATVIATIKDELKNEINQTKTITKDAVNKLKDITKNKNAKLEEKINVLKENLISSQSETKTIEENLISKMEKFEQETKDSYANFEANTKQELQDLTIKIDESNQEISRIEGKVNNSLKQVKNTFIATEKIKKELDEQLINNQNENKIELENISGTIEDMKNWMDVSIDSIGKQVLKLKEATATNLEKQDNTDIELLKKEYNKYTTKVNNELAKISKDIINAQKKNLEQNRNLQVKIKAYIDAKLEKISNTQKLEEVINDLNLSMLEREEVHELEMEKLLAKKLKEIQKENERILNKKIEEITSKLIRENTIQTKQNLNNVTIYDEVPKKKKNMYEVIDNNQILKRSATAKKTLETTQEGKSQILKFFYDEDE